MAILTGKQLHDLFYDPHSPFKDGDWYIEDDAIADSLWNDAGELLISTSKVYDVTDWGYIIWDSPHACPLPKESYEFEEAYTLFMQRPQEGLSFQEALLYAIAHPGVSIKPKDTDLAWRFYDPDEDTFFFHINDDDTTPCHIPHAATIDKLWITDEKKKKGE